MNTNLDLTREQGKRLLWHVIKAWEELSKETYQYLGNSKYVIVEFIGYFLGHSTTLDIRKGIYLYGDYGRGKTLLFRLFSSFTKCTTYRPFDIANCKEIEIEVSEAGDLGPLRKYLSGVWCFNDLGYESRVTKLYGQDVSLMEYILGERSERSLITFATGNLPPQELEKRYGDRIKTRLHSLFNFIELEGPRDFRKTLDNAKSS